MRTFATVVRCQLMGSERLLAAALMLGLMAWLAAWMPQGRSYEPAEVRSIAAFLISIVVGVGGTMIAGANLTSNELLNGRLAFFFVRPISGAVLWWGKLLAALLLVLASILLVWLPALLTGGRPGQAFKLLVDLPDNPLRAWGFRYWIDTWHGQGSMPYIGFEDTRLFWPPELAWLAAGLLFLLLITHLMALALRSRSFWLVLDLAALPLVVALAWLAVERLFRHRDAVTLIDGALLLAATLVGGALAAGLAGVAVGRTLPSRVHAAGSIVFWGTLVLTCGALELHSRAIANSDMEALDAVSHYSAAPSGPWIAAGGPIRGRSSYAPLFVINSQKKTHRKIGLLDGVVRQPFFSADGTVLAIQRAIPGERNRTTLEWLDLENNETVSLDVNASGLESVALNADGSLMAYVEGPRLVVLAMPEARTLVATQMDDLLRRTRLYLEGQETVEVATWETKFNEDGQRVGRMKITAFDLASRAWAEPRLINGAIRFFSRLHREDGRGDRFAARFEDGIGLMRWSDGQELARVAPEYEKIWAMRLLGDGGLLLAENPTSPWNLEGSKGRVTLRRIDPDGNEVWQLPVSSLNFIGNEDDGLIWIACFSRTWPEKPKIESLALDLATGEIVERVANRQPLWQVLPPSSPFASALTGGGDLWLPEDSGYAAVVGVGGD